MMLMKESGKPDSGRGGGEAMRKMSYDSALATGGGDETGEMGRGTLTAQRSVPSNQPDVCFVIGCCNAETGRNQQVVMGRG
jgi:hypothetical protein